MTMSVIIIIFPFGSSAIGELLVEIYVYSELFAEFFFRLILTALAFRAHVGVESVEISSSCLASEN